ncbi:hypothetical protein HKX48_000280 [Thoreauomyces humboldtii]|nr:hypothetical protein HKX48_000280 [Thoreauomyces humboldtii]
MISRLRALLNRPERLLLPVGLHALRTPSPSAPLPRFFHTFLSPLAANRTRDTPVGEEPDGKQPRYRRWTAAEDAELKNLRDVLGWTFSAINNKMGKHAAWTRYQTLQHRAATSRLGAWTQKEDKILKEAFETVPRLANSRYHWIGISKAVVGRSRDECYVRMQRFLAKKRGPYTPEEDAAITEELHNCGPNAGPKVASLSRALDRPLDNVYGRIQTLTRNWRKGSFSAEDNATILRLHDQQMKTDGLVR